MTAPNYTILHLPQNSEKPQNKTEKNLKLSIICFSLTGLETASRLKTEFEKQGHRVLLASKSKYLKDSIQESVLKWTESRFSADDGILFVGACGIAVRSIAPYVASK